MPILDSETERFPSIDEFRENFYSFPYKFGVQVEKIFSAPMYCSPVSEFSRFMQQVCRPTWLFGYAPGEMVDSFRNAFLRGLLSINARVLLFPQSQPIAHNGNFIRLSHHSYGKAEQKWHYKVGYLPNYFHFDRAGFSGWSEFHEAPTNEIDEIDQEVADIFYNTTSNKYKSNRKSKYPQGKSEHINIDNFVFIPLQIPTDAVINLSPFKGYIKTMREAIDIILSTGRPVVIKRHPLDTDPRIAVMLSEAARKGAIITSASIHDIFLRCNEVVTWNSGVGFEALLYGKKVICLGKTEYGKAGWDVQALQELVPALEAPMDDDRTSRLRRLVFLILNKYQMDTGTPDAEQKHILRALCWNYMNRTKIPGWGN